MLWIAMKLSTKILLLIAPVILFSTATSSYIIYSTQKSSFIKREDNALQLSMEKLAGYFRQSRAFLNSYSYTLTKSDMVKNYFMVDDNPNRELDWLITFTRRFSYCKMATAALQGLPFSMEIEPSVITLKIAVILSPRWIPKCWNSSTINIKLP